MTKRIVSGIFILTALGALGVILAGALTSGEQLIVRFLTAVIVAALGLYVISDLRLQADDDAMTSRPPGQPRLGAVDAPPNSTAAFMATVTKKSEAKSEDGQPLSPDQLEPPLKAGDPALEEPEAVPVTAVVADAGVFGRLEDLETVNESAELAKAEQMMAGVGATTTGDFASTAGEGVTSSSVDRADDSGEPGGLDSGNRHVVPSRPGADESMPSADRKSGADATVTDIFAAMRPPVEAKLDEDCDRSRPSENDDGDAANNGSNPVGDDADLTQLLRIGDAMPAPLGTVSEFKSGEAGLNGAVIRSDDEDEDSDRREDQTQPSTEYDVHELADLEGGDETEATDTETADTEATDTETVDTETADTRADGSPTEVEVESDGEAGEKPEVLATTDFEYSGELQSPDHSWPAPPAKLNGSKKGHPFERAAKNGSQNGMSGGLNGHRTSLPVPAASAGMQAADYADAPLAPIIDLREINGQNPDNIDVAINAGELEVIATLIEQGMLSTDGPISDRDVRTMVYVAFTSNELRKLLLAGGSPDGPNYGLDLGPVELFDERIHAPAPKRLYSAIDRPEAQSQIG